MKAKNSKKRPTGVRRKPTERPLRREAAHPAVDTVETGTMDYNRVTKSSTDELVAMQRMANSISTSTEPDHIASTLIELTRQVVPVLASRVFLFDTATKQLTPFWPLESSDLEASAAEFFEGGIIDWVLVERRTVIIPDPDHVPEHNRKRNFVIVPLIIRNQPVGVYIIHSEKPQQEFSSQDIQLLTVLADQAAAGVENWRTYHRLIEANDEVRVAQERMIQATKLAALGELAASILHEIRNPLAIMRFHVDPLQRRDIPAETVEILAQQIGRINEICERLMQFCREDTADHVMEPVDVNKALDDILTVVRYDFKRLNIVVETSYCVPLPYVAANRTYLQQVFLNLFNNARDAMPHGGTISIMTGHAGSRILVKVADTGIGIRKEQQEAIFRPFYTTKEEGKGTGLGLSISRKIISEHGGTIGVESTEGKGSVFTIALPTYRPEARTGEPQAQTGKEDHR